jgi:Pyruvate/2-oxoacid:ferredoxin oxidoreductase gamma subunit
MAGETTNIVLVGTGGQGALTMMEMLALAAEMADQEVRVLSRVSLARLGGTGICHIRLGPASSAAIPIGEADILLTLEMSEVLRVLPMARRGAQAFISTHQRLPIASGIAGRRYPSQAEIKQALTEREVSVLFVPEQLSADLPAEVQASRVNIILLGVLAGASELLPCPILEQAIALRLPQFAQQNIQMFETGWLFAKKVLQGT